MDLKEINRAIMRGDWTNDELNTIIDAVKYRRSFMVNELRRTIREGDRVKFTSRKMGGTVQGTVETVKIKFATVNTAKGRWRVPINMLETV